VIALPLSPLKKLDEHKINRDRHSKPDHPVRPLFLAAFWIISVSICVGVVSADPPDLESVVERFVVGNYEEVKRLSDPVNEPHTVDIQYVRARLALFLGDSGSAVEELQGLLQLDPSHADAHYRLGVIYGERPEKASFLRKPTLARNARKAFELDPRHFPARRSLIEFALHAPGILGGGEKKAMVLADSLASFLDRQGRRGEAINFLETHFRSHSTSPLAILTLARLHFLEGRHSEALQGTDVAISALDDSVQAVLADSTLRNADVDRLIRFQSRRIRTLLTKGSFVADAEVESNQGLEALERFLALTPPNLRSNLAHGHYLTGRIYEGLDRPKAARRAYRTALKLNKSHKPSRTALNALE